MPFVSRTRAILRSAEFGFFGVVVETRVQTPRFCGAPASAGVFVFALFFERHFRISWLTVGMLRLGLVFRVVYRRNGGRSSRPDRAGEAWSRSRACNVKRANPLRSVRFGLRAPGRTEQEFPPNWAWP